MTNGDGEPIEGAEIFIDSEEYGSIGERTTTGPDGRYVLGHVPAGEYYVYARAHGVLDGEVAGVTSRLREDTVGIDFVLPAAPTISGRIVDQDGAPIADQGITCIPSLRHGRPTGVRSEVDGTFTIHAKSLDPHRLHVRKSGYELRGADVSGEVRVEPGARDVELVLRQLPEFTILVVNDKTGDPVSHYGLERTAHAGSKAEHRLVTGGRPPKIAHHPQGRSMLRGNPGVDRLRVIAEGYRTLRIDLGPDEADGSLQTVRLQATEKRTDDVVRGRVIRAGEPAAGVRVVLEAGRRDGRAPLVEKGVFLLDERATSENNETETGVDGRFKIQKGGGSKWRITARSSDDLVAVHEFNFSDPTDVGDLILAPFGSIEGHVIVPEGQSAEGLKVMVDRWWDSPSTMTGSGGRFRFDAIRPGLHGLIVRGRDASLESVEDHTIEVRSGETARTTIDASGHGIARIQLTVTVDGDPVEGLPIDAEPLRSVPFRGRRRIGSFGACDEAGRVEGTFRAYPSVAVGMHLKGVGTLYHPVELLKPELERVAEFTVDFALAEATLRVPEDVQLPKNAFVELDVFRSDRTLLTQRRIFSIGAGQWRDGIGLPIGPDDHQRHVAHLIAGSQLMRLAIHDRDSPNEIFLEAEVTIRKGPDNTVELERVDPLGAR